MKLLKTLLASAVAVSAMPALAYEAGDMMVKAGVINVQPENDVAQNIKVESDTQLGLTFTYMVTSHVGFEVLAATPFTHEVKVKGMGKVGEVSHLPPTVSAQYYPLSPESKIQPYVGLGVNYTFFFDEDDAVDHVEQSTGIAYSIGANYDINDQWLANVALWKMDIDAIAHTAIGDPKLEIDPLVIMVGAGYKF